MHMVQHKPNKSINRLNTQKAFANNIYTNNLRLRRSLKTFLQGQEEENVATTSLGLRLLVPKALLTRRGPLTRLTRGINSHRAQNS